jgi:lipopolysaccharide biosynthesis glycosyltransferase
MKPAFVTTLDDSYFEGFLYTFGSILKNTPNFNYDLVILEWDELSLTNKDIIKKIYSNVYFKKVDIESYKNHKFSKKHRTWNYNCNYRFDIFTLNYDFVVYFDCDILFELPATELLMYDVDFGACQMPKYKKYEQVKGSKVFNAGLMLIGKKYLNENTKRELIKIANEPPSKNTNWSGNQPILNKYFLDKIVWLPNKYNLISEDISIKSFSEKQNYHFVGKAKPWNSDPSKRYEKYILSCVSINNNQNVVFNRMVFKNIEEKYEQVREFIAKILF